MLHGEFVIISFDIPVEKRNLRMRVYRKLAKIGENIQRSLWKIDNFDELMSIVTLLRENNCDVRVLVEAAV